MGLSRVEVHGLGTAWLVSARVCSVAQRAHGWAAQIGPDRTGVGLGSGQLELHRNGIGLGRASLIGSASGRLLRVGSASGRLALI